jgi:hypothetical protein
LSEFILGHLGHIDTIFQEISHGIQCGKSPGNRCPSAPMCPCRPIQLIVLFGSGFFGKYYSTVHGSVQDDLLDVQMKIISA